MKILAKYQQRAKLSKSGVQRTCELCADAFYCFPYSVKKGEARFCSASCRSKNLYFNEGHSKIFSGKGHKMPPQTRSALLHAITGTNSKVWKGDSVGYRSLHYWVSSQLGKPHNCDLCDNDSLNHRQYHWANISGNYMRDLSDWVRLCVKCHKAYDKDISLNKLAY